MAKTLSKTGIVNNEAILAAHVTQSIDALTGVDGYDITISGSLNINNAPVTNLTASGDVDFNGNLDVDGITNLDVVDIDGAVDMASTLVVASHITASSNISSSGDVQGVSLTTDQKIIHNGDADTFINFQDDEIRFEAGGLFLFNIHKDGSGPHEVTVNEGGNNVDFIIEDNANNDYFIADASTTRIGIGKGNTTPSATLHISGAGDTNVLIEGNITASGNVSASGEISADTIVVNSTITHIGDSNTKITFDTDDINLTVAGKTALDITYDGSGGGDTREITFNESHEDIDVRIEGDTDTDLFFTNAGTDRVGIGTNSPSSKLQVDGDITATNITSSGNVKAGRYAETLQDVTAAGSNQGDATDLAGSSANGLFIVSGADNAKGVKLPAVADIPIGTKFTIINTVSNRTLEVYPATDDNIGPTLPDNGAATVPAGGSLIVIKYNANGYMGYFGTAPS